MASPKSVWRVRTWFVCCSSAEERLETAPCEKPILSRFWLCFSPCLFVCPGPVLVKWVIFSIKTAQKKMRFPYLESLYGLQQIASFVRNHQLFLGDVCPEPVVVN